MTSPGLEQGKKLKKKSNNSLEGFQSALKNTTNIVDKNDYTSHKQIIDNLKQEYENTLDQYNNITQSISENTQKYISRVNPSNPYLNKVIKFKTGQQCYVTNQGVAKFIESKDILNSLNITKSTVSVNIPWNQSYLVPGTVIPSNPPLISGTKVTKGQQFGNEGSNFFVNMFLPKNTNATYMGCYSSGSNNDSMTVVDSNTQYTYNQCKQSAVEQGYQYFGLQNVDAQSSKGYCVVSNDSKSISKYGESQIPSKYVALWSTNTSGQSGNTALLSNTGSLQIINSSGKIVYSTPGPNINNTSFLGCYQDCSKGRGLPNYLGNGKTFDTCQSAAQAGNWSYFGLQFTQPNGTSECWAGNDLSQATSMGKASNCKVVNNVKVGGGCSNALYNNKDSTNNYYLILEDNGNMGVYRGSGPDDNQGSIWSANSKGKNKSAYPSMEASKNKYGRNWMASNATLAPGDFVSSNSGNLALVMQTDGNLVLYTYEMTTNCSKMTDGNMGGGVNGTAVYDIGKKSVTNVMGSLGYLDGNADLHVYSDDNQIYNNAYTNVATGFDTLGNDITGASFTNSTLDKCKSACNNNPDCAGFVTNASGTECYPKTSGMYPFGGPYTPNEDRNIYIRDKMPKNTPIGVSQKTIGSDTYTFNNYNDGKGMDEPYGLSKVNMVKKQQQTQLRTKLDLLSKQIEDLTNKFKHGSDITTTQSQQNVESINNYLTGIKDANKKFIQVSRENDGNIQNILTDSDIVVLQKNYNYLFWTILATGTVILSMTVINK